MSASPPLFFLHIPKTGGSSINHFLRSHYADDAQQVHIERVLFDGVDAVERLRQKALLTGHVRIGNALKILGDIPHKKTTMLRDPGRQTLSHLSWVDRLRDPKHASELANSDDYVKRIVERMDSTGIVDFIYTMNVSEKNLFDNNQTRYLLDMRGYVEINVAHLQQAVETLKGLDAVGINEEFGQSLRLFSHLMGWQPPTQEPKENLTERFVGDNVDAAALGCAIRSITAFDEIIYRSGRSIFAAQCKALPEGCLPSA